MLSDSGVTTPSVFIAQDRTVQITAGANFDVTWTSSGEYLRDLLGFSGDLSGSDGYSAAGISPLLFSPGWPMLSRVIPNVEGYEIEDEVQERSVDGTIIDSDYHNTQTWDELEAESVHRNRMWYDRDAATHEQGGTWLKFRQTVLRPNHRFQVYESITEDSASTSAVTFSTAKGPYKRRQLPTGAPVRRIANANSLWNVGVEVQLVSEYT